MHTFWRRYRTGRGHHFRLTFSLLAILTVLASCSLTNSPAAPPPSAPVVTTTPTAVAPTVVAMRGTIPAGVPSSLPTVNGTPGS